MSKLSHSSDYMDAIERECREREDMQAEAIECVPVQKAPPKERYLDAVDLLAALRLASFKMNEMLMMGLFEDVHRKNFLAHLEIINATIARAIRGQS